MRISGVLLAALLCPVVLLGQPGVDELRASIVKITSNPKEGQPRTGTGFIVRVDGELIYIATAAHVVAGDPKPQITFFHDKRRSVAADIGTLEVDNPDAGLGYVFVRDQAIARKVTALSWSAGTLRGGDEVMTIGFGQGSGEWGVIRGTVASASGADIRIDGRIEEGNSGGPILMNGSVAGMVTSVRQGFGVGKSGIIVKSTLAGWDVEVSAPTTAGTSTPVVPAPTTTVERRLSFSSWGGVWDLRFEFQGNWSKRLLNMEATQSGVTGDYGLGTLAGRFREGDVTTVNGTITNTTNTGQTCRSGKQEGSFSLTLAKDGRSMAGWWDVCSEGQRYKWEADRR